MPKYSEILSDEKILNMINSEFYNVLLLGCGGCMNESLAYKLSLPILSYGEELSCPAIEAECHRLKNVLVDRDFSTDILILPPDSNSRCIRNLELELLTLPDNIHPDVILVLACQDGLWGLSRDIKNIPLIRISEWVGMIHYHYSDDGKEKVIKYGEVSSFS